MKTKTIAVFSLLDPNDPIGFKHIRDFTDSLERKFIIKNIANLSFAETISEESIKRIKECLDLYDAIVFLMDNKRDDELYYFNLGFSTCCSASRLKPVVFLCTDNMQHSLCEKSGLLLCFDSLKNDYVKSALQNYLDNDIQRFWVSFSLYIITEIKKKLSDQLEINQLIKPEEEIILDLQNDHPNDMTTFEMKREVLLRVTKNHDIFGDILTKELHPINTVKTPYTRNKETDKVIKIFLASSSELKEDRDLFELYFRQYNDKLRERNCYLKVVRWENFLDMMSKTRLQDEYNKAAEDCDIFISLFYTKVGEFTEEEFNAAYTRFKAMGRPVIYTYFKNKPIEISEITTQINLLLDFQSRLSNLGHFHTKYTDIEHLKRQFKDQLEILLVKVF